MIIMIHVLSIKFFLIVLVVFIARISGSQHIKITKCLKQPDTWKKVETAVKECQEDVKLNIIKDAFQSANDEWHDSFFDHDDHDSSYNNQHSNEQYPSISHHHSAINDQSSVYEQSSVYDIHGSVHDNHPSVHSHRQSAHDHYPTVNDNHPSVHNHHSSIHDHYPSVHDSQPSFHDTHPSVHDTHNSVHDTHPSVHDTHDSVHDTHHSVHDTHPSVHDTHPSVHSHHPSPHDHYPTVNDNHPSVHNHHSSVHDHYPSVHDSQPSIHDTHTSVHDTHPSAHAAHDTHHSVHDMHPSVHDTHPPVHDPHPSVHDTHPPVHDPHPSVNDDSTVRNHGPVIKDYLIHRHSSLPHHPETHLSHGHLLPHHERSHHPYLNENHVTCNNLHPKLKIPQHFLTSAHHNPQITIQHNEQHTDTLSDTSVEHHQHIDFTDFRRKRDTSDHHYIHPSTVPYHDKRIAGCVMQCIFEKNHAVDKLGWPTLDGLVNFYSEGVNEHGYFMATLRAVDHCLKSSSAKYHVNRRSTPEKGQTCDVAFDVFDCVSDRITEYCSEHNQT